METFVASGGITFNGISDVIFAYQKYITSGRITLNSNADCASSYKKFTAAGSLTLSSSITTYVRIPYDVGIKLGYKALMSPYNVVPIAYGSDTYGTGIFEYKRSTNSPFNDTLDYNISWDYGTLTPFDLSIKGPASSTENNGALYNLLTPGPRTTPAIGTVSFNTDYKISWLQYNLIYIEISSLDFYPNGDSRGQLYGISGGILFSQTIETASAAVDLNKLFTSTGGVNFASTASSDYYSTFYHSSEGTINFTNPATDYMFSPGEITLGGTCNFITRGRHIATGGVRFTPFTAAKMSIAYYITAANGAVQFTPESFNVVNSRYFIYPGAAIPIILNGSSNCFVKTAHFKYFVFAIFNTNKFTIGGTVTSAIKTENYQVETSGSINFASGYVGGILEENRLYTGSGSVSFGGTMVANIITWEAIGNGSFVITSSATQKANYITINIPGKITFNSTAVSKPIIRRDGNGEITFGGESKFAYTQVINGGVNFTGAATVLTGIRYWVASSTGYWDDGANWSMSSGGTPNAGAPSTFTSVYFDHNGGGDCVIDTDPITCAFIDISDGYVGTLDTGTVPKQINIGYFKFKGSGLIIDDNTTINVGNVTIGGLGSITDNGTWNITGNWDSSNFSGSWINGGSINNVIHMQGTEKSLITSSNSKLNKVIIENATIVNSFGAYVKYLDVYDDLTSLGNINLTINGYLNIDSSGKYLGTGNTYGDSLTITNNGIWTNSGTFYCKNDIGLDLSTFTGSNFEFSQTTSPVTIDITNSPEFGGNIKFTSSGTMNLINNTGINGIIANKNMIFVENSGVINWTKGTNSFIELISSHNSSINLLGKEVDSIIINCSGSKMLLSNMKTDSFTLDNGIFNFNGHQCHSLGNFTINSTGDVDSYNLNYSDIIVDGDLNLNGSFGNLLNLVAGSIWYLTHNGENSSCNYVQVGRCDASDGYTIIATNNTNIESAPNTNWLFPQIVNGIVNLSSSSHIIKQNYNYICSEGIQFNNSANNKVGYKHDSNGEFNITGNFIIKVNRKSINISNITLNSFSDSGSKLGRHISSGFIHFNGNANLSKYYYQGSNGINLTIGSANVVARNFTIIPIKYRKLPVIPYAPLTIEALFVKNNQTVRFYGGQDGDFEYLGLIQFAHSGFHVFPWYNLEHLTYYQWYAVGDGIETPIVEFLTEKACDPFDAFIENGLCCQINPIQRGLVNKNLVKDGFVPVISSCK